MPDTAPPVVCAPRVQPKASDALNSFDYPPVAAVTVSYPVTAVKDERRDASGNMPGFGQLHPRSQVRRARAGGGGTG